MTATAPGTLIISGATGDIGREVARFCGCGYATVALLGRNRDSGESLAREMRDAGMQDVQFISGDVTSSEDAARIVALATRATGGVVAALVNAQGLLPRIATLEQTDASVLEEAYRVNFLGPVLLMRSALRGLRVGKGSIVNIASVSGMHAFPGSVAYGASKAALINASRVLAQEERDNIRVNVLCPGWVKGRLMDRVRDELGVTDSALVAGYPFRRAASTMEVAQAVAWLLSPAASYMSGAVIPLDGGGLP